MAMPAAWALAMSAALAGCSQRYHHGRLGLNSPQAAQVRAMLAELRRAGRQGLPQTLANQAAGQLTASQHAMLAGTLKKLIDEPKVALTRMDRFGPRVYRATFVLGQAPRTRTLALLLVVDQHGKLRWAGPNG